MKKHVLLMTLLLLCSNVFAGQDNNHQTVLKQGVISEDLYLWGERVRVDAEVDGDVVVAGGKITVDGSVSGDVMAAGGEVMVNADLTDDLRAAGGQVTVCSEIIGDAILAGGEITLCDDAVVGDNAWIAGGDVTIDGRIEQNLQVKAGHISIIGEILQDVDLEAKSIEILPSAVIGGNLVFKSPNAANISEGATIVGEVEHSKTDAWWARDRPQWDAGDIARAVALFLLVSILAVTLAALLVSAIFRETRFTLAESVRSQFLRCLGFGLLAVLLTPILIVLSAITIIGLPIAGILLLLYILLIVAGYFTIVLLIAEQIHRWIRKQQPLTTFWQVLTVLLAVFAVTLISLIPLLGGLIMCLAYLAGIGAVCLHVREQRQSEIKPGL
ncbi:MAG: FapA family protein [Arenicella sp.]|nr:FapA family protein [Arenicella sp.]